MKDDIKEELREAAREVCRQLEREQERITEEAERLKSFMFTLESTEEVLQENERLQGEIEQLRSQWQEEKERNTKLEMQLNEMSKMTASVAGKASQDELQKALRVFVNKSKRKKMEKRIAVKEMVQLRSQWQEEKERNTRLEMQLNEMSKLSASVAGKASQDELLKALRVFVNKSKRKKMEKRIAVKEMVLELANANGLVLPSDLAASIDSLDDEQPQVEQPQAATGGVTENVAELLTAEAQVLWQRLRDARFIVADGYALAEGVSSNQAAYIADRMAERLQIRKKWKLFQQLWGIPNLAQLAGTWQQTGKLPPRSSDIDKLTK